MYVLPQLTDIRRRPAKSTAKHESRRRKTSYRSNAREHDSHSAIHWLRVRTAGIAILKSKA